MLWEGTSNWIQFFSHFPDLYAFFASVCILTSWVCARVFNFATIGATTPLYCILVTVIRLNLLISIITQFLHVQCSYLWFRSEWSASDWARSVRKSVSHKLNLSSFPVFRITLVHSQKSQRIFTGEETYSRAEADFWRLIYMRLSLLEVLPPVIHLSNVFFICKLLLQTV